MLMSARSPLEMTVLLMPATMQINAPTPVEQETDLPAAVAAEPAVALAKLTEADGKVTLN